MRFHFQKSTKYSSKFDSWILKVGGGICGVVLERSGYLTHVPGLRFENKLKGDKGFWINSKSMCVIRLPPGYYPYLGQMPGPRDPNQGPNQGYGQGGYNSLNRGNQVRQ